MSALTVISVVEGVSNALLSYFFDPKEPVLELKPLFEKPIDLELVNQVSKEVNAKDYDVYTGPVHTTLITTKGRRAFMSMKEVPADHAFRKVWSPDARKQDVNELHKANMSLLWHETQRYAKGKGYSEQNYLLAAAVVVAVANTNRGRMVHLSSGAVAGMLRFNAVFESFDGSLFVFTFCSDNIHWDLTEKNPKVYDAPYVVVSNYDDHGRITSVTKHRVGNPDDVMGAIGVQYVERRSEMPHEMLAEVKHTVIPTPLIDLLALTTITGSRTTICSQTGARFWTYDCHAANGRTMIVTVRH